MRHTIPSSTQITKFFLHKPSISHYFNNMSLCHLVVFLLHTLEPQQPLCYLLLFGAKYCQIALSLIRLIIEIHCGLTAPEPITTVSLPQNFLSFSLPYYVVIPPHNANVAPRPRINKFRTSGLIYIAWMFCIINI